MSANASNPVVPNRGDLLRSVRIPGWRPVEVVLVAMLLSSFALIPWMRAVYTPSENGEVQIAPGMSKQEVLVILGEPNERQGADLCWDYDRFHENGDQICVRFNADGRVQKVEH